MTIEVFSTNEMTKLQKEGVCTLFKDVFEMDKTYREFIHQFEYNELGYSYFGLVFDAEKIVGSYAVIPQKYNYLEKDVIFGQAVDTMIDENYRGNPFLLKKLAEKVYKRLVEDNINFVFGFPNDNIYLVRKKILKWHDIYNLDIYLLPIHIGAIKNVLQPLNVFSKLLSKTLNALVSKRIDLSETYHIYKQNTSEYLDYRFSNSYQKINVSNEAYAFYTIQEFDGIRTAFVVEVYPLTKNNLEYVVKNISANEKHIDLVAYFGYLDFKPINLFKIPSKYKPKDTFMSGKILNKNKIGDDVFDVKNWRVNLSNFDWI